MNTSGWTDADKEFYHLLEKYGLYIRTLAYQYIPSDNPLMEREDLIQRSHVKLWQATMKRPITHPKSYISRIVRSAYVDMWREYNAEFSLSLNNDGELIKGTLLISCSEGMGDPQDELERKEAFVERLDMLTFCVTRLPQQQRKAMLLRLKKRVDNLSLLARFLQKYKVTLETMHSPTDKATKQCLASSVAPALTKIDAFFKNMSTR